MFLIMVSRNNSSFNNGVTEEKKLSVDDKTLDLLTSETEMHSAFCGPVMEWKCDMLGRALIELCAAFCIHLKRL